MSTHHKSQNYPDDVDFKDGTQEVDPVTGYDTTGHVWNGIRELNTPFPRIVLFFLAVAFIISVAMWVLLPAWPVGDHYTRGILAASQETEAVDGFLELEKIRHPWLARFDGKPDFAAITADKALLAEAMPAAQRLFKDNCAACHGERGTGGPGFPDLADTYWLWGGDPATIAETIRVGINRTDDDTRISQMPAVDSLSLSDRENLVDYVIALPDGKADASMPGAALFSDNCKSCHGDKGVGGLKIGAPSLVDHSVIYGQDRQTVSTTLAHGRQGVMPTWGYRFSTAEINLLAVYVAQLAQADKQAQVQKQAKTR
ncbi:MAG: cytochrome-c oxidase, cbb3-type subunit III [Hyphomicrobiaceae bacterium]